jgi:ankyrin repeat protein
VVVALLSANCQHDAVTASGSTALHIAAKNGVDLAVAALLQWDSGGALDRPDGKGRTALHLAIAMGHLTVVQLLIAAGASVLMKVRPDTVPVADARHVISRVVGRHVLSCLVRRTCFFRGIGLY